MKTEPTVWRAVIRIKGYPSISDHFDRKQEADDWAKDTERRIKLGQFNFAAHNKHHTYADLLHRMEGEGAFELQRSFKHCKSQFDYWKERLGVYAEMYRIEKWNVRTLDKKISFLPILSFAIPTSLNSLTSLIAT